MADGVRLLYQLGRLPEVGVGSGGIHQGSGFTLTDDRAGEHCLARRCRGGQGLPGQGGLVHLDRVARQQAGIGRDDVTKADADDVARHQLPRRRRRPLPVANHAGLDRQIGFQRVDGVACLSFLPESDHRVGDEQDKDDKEVRPVPVNARQDHSTFDHPGDGTPEVGQELAERTGLLLLDLIGPILRQTLRRLGLAQPVRRGPKLLLHLMQGKGFQVICHALTLSFGLIQLDRETQSSQLTRAGVGRSSLFGGVG